MTRPKPIDLHPEDLAARIRLRHGLVALRHLAGWSQRDLSTELGLTPTALGWWERQPEANSLTVTFARYAAVFNHQIRIVPVGVGVETPVSRNYTAMAAAQRDLVEAHRFEMAAVVEQLVAYRRSEGISHLDMGRRLGRDDSSISQLERGIRDNPRLSSWQRYTRALGGHLNVGLVPAEGAA